MVLNLATSSKIAVFKLHFSDKIVVIGGCRSAAKAAKHSTQVFSDAKPAGGAAAAASKRPTQPRIDYFDMTN